MAVAYGWGNNENGQLGIESICTDDNEPIVMVPTIVEAGQTFGSVIEIACGWHHTLFLMDNCCVCSCGLNDFGQLGRRTTTQFDRVENLPPVQAEQVSCGGSHSLVVNKDGNVYAFGSNEYGQLGIDSQDESSAIPRQVSFSPSGHVFIIQVACGKDHSLALSSAGQIFSWGNNLHGQLGIGKRSEKVASPQLLLTLLGSPIYKIFSGSNHATAITISGTVFAWGKNEYGQLGTGDQNDKLYPQRIEMLSGQGILHMSCGDEHTAALTMDGHLFTFGCGLSGQLGHSNFNSEYNPKVILDLMGSPVSQICCGRKHTMAFVASTSRLYTFGLGVKGQLGIDSITKHSSPMLVKSSWRPYDKQYLETVNNKEIFKKDNYYFHDDYIHSLNNVLETLNGQMNDSNNILLKIYAGSLQSFCILKPYETFTPPIFHSILKTSSLLLQEDHVDQLIHRFKTNEDKNIKSREVPLNIFKQHTMKLVSNILKKLQFQLESKIVVKSLIASARFEIAMITLKKHGMKNQAIFSKKALKQKRLFDVVRNIFSNQSCLCASFLKRVEHLKVSPDNHGLQLIKMRSNLKKICDVEELRKCVIHAVTEFLIPSLKSNKALDTDSMRVYLLIPEVPFFNDTTLMWKILLPFANTINDLPKQLKTILEKWWSKLPATFLTRLIQSFTGGVIGILDEKLPETANQVIFQLHAALRTCMTMLERLYEINKTAEHSVLYSTFYIDGIMEKIDMKGDYLNWIQNRNIFSFCQYPFVLDGKIKAALLSIDADFQMQAIVSKTHISNFASILQGNASTYIMNPFLVLDIRRDHIVQDTLTGIAGHDTWDLKKPLKIKFSNEEAEDAGGVKKEFFLLLMKEILDPKYGMFDYNNESRLLWFNASAFEGPEMFGLIGMICGLAIYNSIIIDLPFPSCLYKKLLHESPNLDDLKELDPSMAKNFEYMLEYQGEDFNEIFDLNFQVSEMHFGELKTVDLKVNASNIQVTQENKEEYVKEFVNYKLNSSVESQFKAFATGFRRVCGSDILDFFHPLELMEMVVGNQDYDFADLEKVAQYKGEYYRHHPVIENFWTVFYEFDITYKKKFLAFLTGSDKVSIFGMKQMKFYIQPVSGGEKGEHLPVAHTCFNLLDLPRYPSIEMMRQKLCQAIENSQGFGLV